MTPEQAVQAKAQLDEFEARLNYIARKVDSVTDVSELTPEFRALLAERAEILDQKQQILERALGKDAVRRIMLKAAGVG